MGVCCAKNPQATNRSYYNDSKHESNSSAFETKSNIHSESRLHKDHAASSLPMDPKDQFAQPVTVPEDFLTENFEIVEFKLYSKSSMVG